MTRSDSIRDRAYFLVNTSVEDMQSSLPLYTYLCITDVQTVRLGLAICKKWGEKTKVKILERKLKRMEKDLAAAPTSQADVGWDGTTTSKLCR